MTDSTSAPGGDQPPQHATSTGLDPKVAGLLAYLLGWVTGLVLYLVEKEHREVRFHAAQSILVSVVFIAVYVVLGIVAMIPFLGWLIGVAGTVLVGIAGVALWVYLLIQGYNLRHVRLPVVGAVAEQWASR